MPNVLMNYKLSQSAVDIFAAHGFDRHVKTGPSPEALQLESDFPENLLYLRNYDKPGFIGGLGTLCGQ